MKNSGITPHKGGRTEQLPVRLTPAEAAAIRAAAGPDTSIADWVARCATLPTSEGQRVKVTIARIAGEAQPVESRVALVDSGKLVLLTNAGQRIVIETLPDPVTPPPAFTHFVVTGGLIFAAASETQANSIAGIDHNARIFTDQKDAETWVKGATDEVAPVAGPFVNAVRILHTKDDEIVPPGEWDKGR